MKPHRIGNPNRLVLLPGIAGAALGLLACLAVSAQPPPAPDTAAPMLSAPSAGTGAAAAGAGVEVVNLSVQGAFSAPSVRAGETVEYVLRVEWPETGVPVMVLAPDSIQFPGLKVASSAAAHKKVAVGGGLGNRSEFTWKLVGQTPGNGKASSVKVRVLTGISRNEESHFVPTAHVDILPAATPLADRLWFRLLAGWLGLAGAGAAAYAVVQVAGRKKKTKAAPAEDGLRLDVLAMKPRLRGGDSKAILLDMEALCIRHLARELDGAAPVAGKTGVRGDAAPKFDPLLDRHLAGPAGKAPEAADWQVLRELFRHARFAGGHKEPHELQDAYRVLKKCLRITDETGDA